jgi:hypothetical protein
MDFAVTGHTVTPRSGLISTSAKASLLTQGSSPPTALGRWDASTPGAAFTPAFRRTLNEKISELQSAVTVALTRPSATSTTLARVDGPWQSLDVSRAAHAAAAPSASVATVEGAPDPAVEHPANFTTLSLDSAHVAIASATAEVALQLNELRSIVLAAMQRADADVSEAKEASERAREQSKVAQERCQQLNRDNGILRKELDAGRNADLRQSKRGTELSAASLFASDAPSAEETLQLRNEVTELRRLLSAQEGKQLVMAADMSTVLSAAAKNQQATLRVREVQAELVALRSRHVELQKGYDALESDACAERTRSLQRLHTAQCGVRGLQTTALRSIALAAGVGLAARYFHVWSYSARHRVAADQLYATQARADIGQRLLSTAESDLGTLKLKLYNTSTKLQEDLDVYVQRSNRLTRENAALRERVNVLSRLVSGGGAAAFGTPLGTSLEALPIGSGLLGETSLVATGNPSPRADDAAGSPGGGAARQAESPTLHALPMGSFHRRHDRRGAPTTGAEQQQIDALEAYNVLMRTLRSCRERLHLKCVPLYPLQMHERTTVSVVELVIAWIHRTCSAFSRLFALESRVIKARTRLLCAAVGTRGKVAVIAVKLSLPIGTLEGQILTAKKQRYGELLNRISSLRGKIESARESIYRNFDVARPQAAVSIVEGIEHDVALIIKVQSIVEKDQFNLSLQLTKVRLEAEHLQQARLAETVDDAAQSPLSDAQLGAPLDHLSLPPPSMLHGAESGAETRVLAQSKALLQDLRSASAPLVPSHTPAPPIGIVRHGALTPLEDRAAAAHAVPFLSAALPYTTTSELSSGHQKLLVATGTIAPPPPKLSSLMQQRARQERMAALQRSGHKVPATGVPTMRPAFQQRTSTVIPFRNFTNTESEVSKRRVRLAEELFKQ